jgi:tryptophan halogenase
MVPQPVREDVRVVEGQARSILIVGGGTAGWLTAAYLARFLGPETRITLLEDPAIGAIGVGEGAFPTMRSTLRFLGIDEAQFIRAAGATFKQGIRFDDWRHAPDGGRRPRYVRPSRRTGSTWSRTGWRRTRRPVRPLPKR